MEKKRRIANGVSRKLDPELMNAEDDTDDDNEKPGLYRAAQSSMIFSLVILFSILFYISYRLDIVHIALHHETTYHANHLVLPSPKSFLSIPAAPQLSSVELKGPKDPDLESGESLVKSIQQPKQQALPEPVDLATLTSEVNDHIEIVRKMKFDQHIVMERDTNAQHEISVLQDVLRKYLVAKYGPEPYVVKMTLQFPEAMHTEDRRDEEYLYFELAPIALAPYSTYKFLEIMETFQGGNFHRRAGHVLQAMVRTKAKHLAFQEYNPSFPHVKYTLGYAGRPGGPAFYISTVDNTQNHGPASQGSATEADSCFGKLVSGFDVVKRMQKQPGGAKGSGFVNDSKFFIRIAALALQPAGTKVP